MPIVYVHGVSVRDDREWDDLQLLLRRYIAPTIANDPQNVQITRCYWGDFGAKFRWNGACAPESPLHDVLSKLSKASRKLDYEVMDSPRERLKLSKQKLADKTKSAFNTLKDSRLGTLTKDALSDLLASSFSQSKGEQPSDAVAMIAADEVASDAGTFEKLARCNSMQEEIALVNGLISERYRNLKTQIDNSNLPHISQRLGLHIEESLARGVQGAGHVVTRAASEMRAPLNRFVTLFMGDVLTYIHQRGDCRTPGWIPTAVLSALREARNNQMERNGEPLIVMTHSMGGQIIYDCITHFLPRLPEYQDIRIDFWAATASQVGLFEELKLFLESSEEYCEENGNLVPFPNRAHLGYWWNVWDHNDFVSWSGNDIFEDIDDEPYQSGLFVVDAHGGYLVLPSFFRKFAKKLEYARKNNWFRDE